MGDTSLRNVMLGGAKAAKIVTEINKTSEKLDAEFKSFADLENTINSLAALKSDLSLRLMELQQLQRSALQENEAAEVPARTTADMNRSEEVEKGEALRIWNDLNFEEPSKGVFASLDTPPEEVIKLALKKYKIDDDPKKYVLIEVFGAEEHLVEEPPLAVKKRWDAKGRKDFKIFISKKIKEGAIRVRHDNTAGEGFKSLFVTSETTTDEMIAQALRKFRLPNQDTSAYKVVFTHGSVERVLQPQDKPFEIVSKWTRRGEGEKIRLDLRAKESQDKQKSPIVEKKPRFSSVITPSAVKQLKAIPENDYCADCDDHDPDYISMNLGIYLCRQCARLHQDISQSSFAVESSLSRPFQSVVRPVQYFAWPTHILETMTKLGNGVGNAFWESQLSATGTKKPTPSDSRELKEAFIIDKYVNKRFLDPQPDFNNTEVLFKAMEQFNILRFQQLLASGVNPNVTGGKFKTTALHTACTMNHQTFVEFLLYAGANPCAEDAAGKTPLLSAAQKNNSDVVETLKDYQLIYQTAIRGIRQMDASKKIDQRLLKMSNADWRLHLNDILTERDRRASATYNKDSHGGNGRDRSSTNAPANPSDLTEDEFQKMTAGVYEELTYREMSALYRKLKFVPSPDSGDDWYLVCRKKQAFECVTGGMPNSAPSFSSSSASSSSSIASVSSSLPSTVISAPIQNVATHAPPTTPKTKPAGAMATPFATAAAATTATSPPTSPSLSPSSSSTQLDTISTSNTLIQQAQAASIAAAAALKKANTADLSEVDLKALSKEERLAYQQKKLEEKRRLEEEARLAKEKLIQEKQKKEAEAMLAISKQQEEKRRKEEEHQRKLDEIKRADALRFEDELSLLQKLAQQDVEELSAEAAAQRAEMEREALRKMAEDEARKAKQAEERRIREEELRIREEAERAEAEERARIQAQQDEIERKRREEIERVIREKREEEERIALLEQKRIFEEAERMQREAEELERAEQEQKQRLQEQQLAQSMNDIQLYAALQEKKKQEERDRIEKDRQASLVQNLTKYQTEFRGLTDQVVTAIKSLLLTAQSGMPSQYVAATADVATNAHPMVLLSEQIISDPEFDSSRKQAVEQCGEKIMDSIKTIVEKAKTAARLHPSQDALDLLKAGAKQMIQSIKDFNTALALPKY